MKTGVRAIKRRFELRCDLPSNGMRVSVRAKKRGEDFEISERGKDITVGMWRLKDEEKNFVVCF